MSLRCNLVGLCLGLVFLGATDAALAAGSDNEGVPCTLPPSCSSASECSNTPFEPTRCMTTEYGPARANIVIGKSALKSTNMLYCPPKGIYALCFFSGPPYKTGNDKKDNQVLQCTPDGETGIANCQCEMFHASQYYVDINSILNLGAWFQTTSDDACGPDGSLCKNIAMCNDKGQNNSCVAEGTCAPCPDRVAPVCDYVAAQSEGDSSRSLYPAERADLVSTFSFAMGNTQALGAYTLGSVPCSGRYAGCMTAPCTFPEGVNANSTNGTIVNCACPMWSGDYEIGQSVPGCPAEAATWVWSAAHSVDPESQSN
ncbi:MAG: hypothetical protein AB7E72_18470 [Lysobacterales bacterium]